jgi:cytoskeletal protein CcmA (bactofilin family)
MFSKADKASNGQKAANDGSNVAPSIISTNLHIVGNLKTEGEVQVDGTIDGDVTSRSLTIGEKAKVSGEIIAQTVEIMGAIEGRVRAREVRLSKTAHVIGDIVHEILSIESGAYMEGQLMRADTKKAADKPNAAFGAKAADANRPDAPAVAGEEAPKAAASA